MSWLKERIAAALVSAIAAMFTLALYPIALLLIGGFSGGGGELELAGVYYALLSSKLGIIIVLAAALTGFWVGSERMAGIFSFFWGTHSLWSRVDAYLQEKLAGRSYDTPVWILAAVLIAFAAVLVWRFH
jgi:hypothetical protein